MGTLRRHVGTIVAGVLCVAIVAVPVVWVATSSTTASRTSHPPKVGGAVHRVLAALGTTTGSGNFAVSYLLTESASSSASPPSTGCGVVSPVAGAPSAGASSASCVGAGPHNVRVSGQGTIDVSPMAMVVSADVSDLGLLSIRVNATTVWEGAAGDTGLVPSSGVTTGSGGQQLSSFAGVVEGTLGTREGAIAMLGMASPNGFLDLSQSAVTGATQTGAGTVDGVPVTDYRVSLDLARLAQTDGASGDEITTIDDAVNVLDRQGYTSTSEVVAVDGDGFIREITPVANFGDGGTVTLDATFSNFGCAGAVLMPGQQGSTNSATCSSPDATVTTTTGPSNVPATGGSSPTTSPPLPFGSVPTTSTPPSTTTSPVDTSPTSTG